ncbi:peptidase S11 [Candidatus Thorarchaeota archaeon]|nr:MAG: peptidase S11 [Candidatus Thorarchaeota archaeon]
MLKRFEIVWLVLLFLLGCVYGNVTHADPTFNAKQAYVVNLDTGEVVIGKNQEKVAAIASITKLMTAYVIATSNLTMAEEIKITKADFKATGKSRRSVGLFLGSTYTREELLLLALMSSSNRAAAALARSHPTGYVGFIKLMNQKAAELGMINTRYVDPTGIYNDNVSTPEDLVKLLSAVREHPMIGRFSTETYYKKEHEIVTRTKVRVKNKKTKTRWVERTREIIRSYGTTNRLLLTDDWNIHLQKTGFIRVAGFCMVMILEINGENYAMVMLNARNKKVRAIDAVKAKYWVEFRVAPTRQVLAKLDPYRRRR